MVTNELRGERVDVVPFSDDAVELIQSALAPARVREVRLDEETGTATVVVSDYQLSLAIGKEGQNARLAARLTGWRIDIKSESQLEEEASYAAQDWAEGEWIENEAGEMVWRPAEGGEAVSAEEWSRAAEDGGGDGSEPAPTGGEGAPAPSAETERSSPESGARLNRMRRNPLHRRRLRPLRSYGTHPRPVGKADPRRTCVGCRRVAPSTELIRVAMDTRGELLVSRTAPGRGAWLCAGSPGCLREAARRRAFERAFRRPVDRDVVSRLLGE